jgi:HEAT repeat protein
VGGLVLLGAGVVVWLVLSSRGPAEAPSEVAGGKAGESAAKAGGTETAPVGELASLIDKARKDHPLNRGQTLLAIYRTPPVDSARKDVVDVCCLALEAPEEAGHVPAAWALHRWMTPEAADIARLVKIINGGNGSACIRAIEGARRLSDARLAQAVAKRFKEHRFVVSRCLGEMGPVAEPYVLPYVNDPSTEVVRDALRVLRRVGTAKAVPAVQEVTAHKDANLAMRARGTVRAIQRRAANGGKDAVNPEYKPKPLPPDRPPQNELDKLLWVLRGMEEGNAVKSLWKLNTFPRDEERRFEVVARIAEAVEGMDGATGDAAADTLWRWATPETFPLSRVLHLCDSELDGTRRHALLLLGKYRGNKDAAEELGESFPHDAGQAEAALVAIGPVGEPHLLRLLQGKQSPDQIRSTFRALRRIGTDATIKEVTPLLDGRDDRVAMLARTTVKAIRRRLDNGGKDPVNPEYKPQQIQARPTPDQIDKLVAGTRSWNNAVQLKALQTLALVKPQEERRYEVVQALTECLDRTEFGLAAYAAVALPNWVTPETLPLSRVMHATFRDHLLGHPAAIRALGKYRNNPEAAELLAEWLPHTPRASVAALREIGPVAQPHLLPLLQDKRRDVPRNAMRVLAKIGDKNALGPLREIATGKHRDLPPWARLAIAMIERREANGGKDPVNPEYKPSALPRDRAAKDDLDKDVAVARLPLGTAQLNALGRLAKAPFDPERGSEVAGVLIQVAGTDSLAASPAAAAFDVWVRPETAPVAELLYLVDADNSYVRDQALRMLGRYKSSKEAGQCLAEMLPVRPADVTVAFKTMGPTAEEFLGPLLDAPKRDTVVAACAILEHVGTAASVARLERLTKHRDRQIQGAAGKTLAAIRKR